MGNIQGNILYLPFYLLNFFVSICFKLNEEQNLYSPIYHFWIKKKKRKRKKYLILCNLHVLFGLFVVFGHFFFGYTFFCCKVRPRISFLILMKGIAWCCGSHLRHSYRPLVRLRKQPTFRTVPAGKPVSAVSLG